MRRIRISASGFPGEGALLLPVWTANSETGGLYRLESTSLSPISLFTLGHPIVCSVLTSEDERNVVWMHMTLGSWSI